MAKPEGSMEKIKEFINSQINDEKNWAVNMTKMEVNNDGHKDYIFKSLAKKWWNHRYNLYNCAQCDPDASRESNIAKKPEEIPLDQWVAFINYRARPDIKKLLRALAFFGGSILVMRNFGDLMAI